MTSGLHHITLITRKVQANVDFYVGFLGLKLVKRTAGFEDSAQLHLIYGDAVGSPGSLVTFLVWEDGAHGRVGHGQPSELSLAIAPESIGFWLTRALRYHVEISGPQQEFGEPVLRLKDPDGIIVKLVGTNAIRADHPHLVDDVPAEDAIIAMRGTTILTEKTEETAAFVARHFGLRETDRTDSIRRLTSDAGDIVDVRDAGGFWTAAPGTGTIDHIAFRATDKAAVDKLQTQLESENAGDINAHDRSYFYSLYVREPGGTLFEYASDGPGMLINEGLQTLGTGLFVPAHFRENNGDILTMLPQFSLPGEERIVQRDLPFIHRLHQPETPDGTTAILLHGSGGNETSLLPYGRRMMPNALLLALRGRSTEEGVPRFFRRFSMDKFDQKDIASEAEALAATIEDTTHAYGIDLDKTVFIGYSNGANMLAATMLLHPGLIRRAVLMRAMNPLETVPPTDLSGTQVLTISGEIDAYARYANGLETVLRTQGADVESVRLMLGHEIGELDVDTVRQWLDR